jgi:signal transduction histidine kinase
VRINLILVTGEPGVAALCREVAGEYSPEFECEVNVSPQLDPRAHGNSDLCLLDFSDFVQVPEEAPWGRTHFVLLRGEEAVDFRRKHPKAAESVLLKPVSRAALRGVVAQAILLKRAESPENPSALRVDRDELLQSLIYANLKLQEHDQERTNLLSRAAHDVGAPAMALSGYCGLLLEEQLGPLTPYQKDVLQRMLKSVRRSARIAQALCELSAGRHVDERPRFRLGDIRDCVEQSLSEMVQLTDEKEIQTFVDLHPAAGSLSFDPAQMQEVLTNLLDNACRFTPRNGWIEIKGYPYFWDRGSAGSNGTGLKESVARLQHDANSYRVDVKDSGPGIRPERLTLIFEDSTSYDGRGDRSGAGLGLAICKRIIGQHSGRIWAESKPEGAAFSFVLPMHTAAGSTAPF